MMRVLQVALITGILATASQGHAEGNSATEGVDLVKTCQKDKAYSSSCSKAKGNEEAHECIEKIGRLNKQFRNTECWKVNEKYEATRSKTEAK